VTIVKVVDREKKTKVIPFNGTTQNGLQKTVEGLGGGEKRELYKDRWIDGNGALKPF